MKIPVLIIFLFSFCTAFAQTKKISWMTGQCVNTQFVQFRNQHKNEAILYNISPWFINIDSFGRCSIILKFEQKSDMGFPIDSSNWYGLPGYHYKKNYNVWLSNVKDTDSLLVYSNGITPGAGIIFKRYYGEH